MERLYDSNYIFNDVYSENTNGFDVRQDTNNILNCVFDESNHSLRVNIKNIDDLNIKHPHFKIDVKNNNLETFVTNSNTYYKCNFINKGEHSYKFTLENNKYIFDGDKLSNFAVWINGKINLNNRLIKVALFKNNIEPIFPIVLDQDYFSTIFYLKNINKNDYFEIFVNSDLNNDIIILKDIKIFILAS